VTILINIPITTSLFSTFNTKRFVSAESTIIVHLSLTTFFLINKTFSLSKAEWWEN